MAATAAGTVAEVFTTTSVAAREERGAGRRTSVCTTRSARRTRAGARRRARGRAPRAGSCASSDGIERRPVRDRLASSGCAARWRSPTSSGTRYRPPGRSLVEQASTSAGTTASGSGRSEMSSPGNASWCISVRMSPGSTHEHPELGLLDREDRREVLERGLRRAVAAPLGYASTAASDVTLTTVPSARREQRREAPASSASGATTLTS